MSIIRRLLGKINNLDRRSGLFRRGDRILIGLSGGPDSTALLLLLKKLEHGRNFSLYAAHLNHGLTRQASAFERAARRLALENSVPFLSKKVSVAALARSRKRTVEEAGRDARYAFFLQAARKFGARKIATAHTLDDQAETVLLRIVRGAGLRGIAGIPVIRKHENTHLIRPLLDISKKELLQFLKEESQTFTEDRSNRSSDYSRNRMRHDILPRLHKSFNPRIAESLSDLARTAGQTAALIGSRAEQAWKRCLISINSRQITLRAELLARLPRPVADEVLWRSIECLRGSRVRVCAAHLDAIHAILRSAQWPQQTHLPQGLSVRVQRAPASLTPSGGTTIITFKLSVPITTGGLK